MVDVHRQPAARAGDVAAVSSPSTTRRSSAAFAPPPVDEIDLITYLRPSRYCESDTLGPTAASQFAGLEDQELLAAVTDWVDGQLTYVPGSSLPTDGAVRTLLGRQGVCRDFAHLSHRPAAGAERAGPAGRRLRARPEPDGVSRGLPRRMVDGRWWVVDATRLAPRQSLLRVATGRDAADTAFLTNFGGMAP